MTASTTPAGWLNQRRIRAHAMMLAFCLWSVCAVDYATPGVFDRAGNIKFQDFIQVPIAARLIAQGRINALYDTQVLNQQIRAMVGNTKAYLEFYQAPQVVLPFLALSRLSFLTQAAIWVTLSLLIYFACVYELWKTCSALRPYPKLVALCAIAYPPLFHFFARGQLSVLILLCFTGAYLAFRARRDWLAGIALGCLVFKPQFLVAIPVVLLAAQAWKAFSGLAISAAAQLAFAVIFFGQAVIRTYVSVLLHHASQPELSLSPDQMHSLRSFWVLLIPSTGAIWVLYALSCIATIVLAAAVWKSSSPLALRFSALTLAAVLVNPHLFVYDLLALVPVFILTADWILSRDPQPSSSLFAGLLYLAFVLPLFGPLSRWTHIQLSVIVFVALLGILYRDRTLPLASAESAVV
ncbi:MAG TPA: glycosyltransferase family 87 protein [Candidatus Binatia bacterium]|nr:glycosyltransferase family 87 protein [Candidatus Binatia bacterium]